MGERYSMWPQCPRNLQWVPKQSTMHFLPLKFTIKFLVACSNKSKYISGIQDYDSPSLDFPHFLVHFPMSIFNMLVLYVAFTLLKLLRVQVFNTIVCILISFSEILKVIWSKKKCSNCHALYRYTLRDIQSPLYFEKLNDCWPNRPLIGRG